MMNSTCKWMGLFIMGYLIKKLHKNKGINIAHFK